MPAGLTIFAAQYLVFIAGLLAALALAIRLWPRSRIAILRWAMVAGVLLLLSFVFGLIAAGLYNDPRPFTTSHVAPLIPHAADNGFPSDHALLAAALVAIVAVVDVVWSLPLVLLAILVDWARVGAGIHHVVDVVGSSLIVAVATAIALLAAHLLVPWLATHLPGDWERKTLLGNAVR